MFFESLHTFLEHCGGQLRVPSYILASLQIVSATCIMSAVCPTDRYMMNESGDRKA